MSLFVDSRIKLGEIERSKPLDVDWSTKLVCLIQTSPTHTHTQIMVSLAEWIMGHLIKERAQEIDRGPTR